MSIDSARWYAIARDNCGGGGGVSLMVPQVLEIDRGLAASVQTGWWCGANHYGWG